MAKRSIILLVPLLLACVLPAAPARTSSPPAARQCPPTDPGRIPEFIDWMTNGNCNHPGDLHGCKLERMPYKTSCVVEAHSGSDRLYRANRSANECVAWAVREALAGDKYRAVAWLAIAECHDPCARKTINDHKRAAYDYLVNNYVAVWRHRVPEPYLLNKVGQAMKVGRDYREDELDDCVGEDAISLIQVPPGLKITVCEDETGPEDEDNYCKTFGPGNHGPESLGHRLHDEISFARVFR